MCVYQFVLPKPYSGCKGSNFIVNITFFYKKIPCSTKICLFSPHFSTKTQKKAGNNHSKNKSPKYSGRWKSGVSVRIFCQERKCGFDNLSPHL